MINYYYLYGLINGIGIEDLRIKGINNCNILTYETTEYTLVYSLIDTKILSPELTNLLKHEEVLEKLIEGYDVLPFSFSTILLSENSLGKFCNKYHDGIIKNFQKISGGVELGVKVMSYKDIDLLSNENKEVKGKNGYGYMLKKYEEFKNRKALIEEIKGKVSPIEEAIAHLYREKKEKYHQSSKILFNGSYLVAKEDVEEFRECIEKTQLQEGMKVVFSGPWPPYNFVSLQGKDDD